MNFEFYSFVNFFYNRNDKETCSPPWIINCRLYVNDYYNIINVSFKIFAASTANTAGKLLKNLFRPIKIIFIHSSTKSLKVASLDLCETHTKNLSKKWKNRIYIFWKYTGLLVLLFEIYWLIETYGLGK